MVCHQNPLLCGDLFPGCSCLHESPMADSTSNSHILSLLLQPLEPENIYICESPNVSNTSESYNSTFSCGHPHVSSQNHQPSEPENIQTSES